MAEGPPWARKRLRTVAPLGVEGEVDSTAFAVQPPGETWSVCNGLLGGAYRYRPPKTWKYLSHIWSAYRSA